MDSRHTCSSLLLTQDKQTRPTPPPHTHARTHTTAFTGFLTYCTQTSGIYTLQIKQTHTHTGLHTNKIKHTPNRKQAGERCRERRASRFEEFTESGRAGWKLTGSQDSAARGIDELRGTSKAWVVTLGGVWRACSLRRTSRHCCRMPSPSEEPLEPCSHECHCNKHSTRQKNECRKLVFLSIIIIQMFRTVSPSGLILFILFF